MTKTPEDLHTFQGSNINWQQKQRFPRQLFLPWLRGSSASRVCEPVLVSEPYCAGCAGYLYAR